MALDRFYRLPKARQDAIVRGAAEAFAASGYEGTSFNGLLETLRLSKSQAYYYFADKADLFVTACVACYEDYYREVAALPAPRCSLEFWERVRELHEIGFRFQQTHPVAAELNRALVRSPLREELGRSSAHRAPGTRAMHTEWLTLGQRLGAVRTDLPTDLLVGLSVGMSIEVDLWFAGRAEAFDDAALGVLARQMRDLFRGTFAPPAAPPGVRAAGARAAAARGGAARAKPKPKPKRRQTKGSR